MKKLHLVTLLTCAALGLNVAAQTAPAAPGTPGAPAAGTPPAAAPTAPALVVPPGSVALVTHLSGTLTATREGQPSRVLAPRSAVNPGETLNTQSETYARLKFLDGTEVVLRPASQFRIDNYAFDDKEPTKDNVAFSLVKGGLRAISGLISKRNRDKIQYVTPTATVGIRGTHFGMLFCSDDCSRVPGISGTPPANGLHMDVASGQVVVTTNAGSSLLSSGQFGFVADANSTMNLVPPQNGIRVTMPAIIATDGNGRVNSNTLNCTQ